MFQRHIYIFISTSLVIAEFGGKISMGIYTEKVYSFCNEMIIQLCSLALALHDCFSLIQLAMMAKGEMEGNFYFYFSLYSHQF